MAIVRLRPGELKHALESGSLSLHYQPQVEIATGRLAGAEAFVRWPHPAHGMIGPSEIIPLVDQAGLHVEFDRWVVREICLQTKRWRKSQMVVPVVAANVWAQTLRAHDALRLMDAIAETGADPKTIELECPRGATGDTTLTKTLLAIRALGVRIASEEYVTGARPAGKLVFDTLKIPFPISRDHRAHAQAIRGLVAEAAKTKARVVADSVETAEQEAALADLGVTIVQGYLYGPEVSPEELRTLIAPKGKQQPSA